MIDLACSMSKEDLDRYRQYIAFKRALKGNEITGRNGLGVILDEIGVRYPSFYQKSELANAYTEQNNQKGIFVQWREVIEYEAHYCPRETRSQTIEPSIYCSWEHIGDNMWRLFDFSADWPLSEIDYSPLNEIKVLFP